MEFAWKRNCMDSIEVCKAHFWWTMFCPFQGGADLEIFYYVDADIQCLAWAIIRWKLYLKAMQLCMLYHAIMYPVPQDKKATDYGWLSENTST